MSLLRLEIRGAISRMVCARRVVRTYRLAWMCGSTSFSDLFLDTFLRWMVETRTRLSCPTHLVDWLCEYSDVRTGVTLEVELHNFGST